ncbi:MAG: NAD-dependent epimerase/dehydratase family protein [Alphaproteobacteria bacterium]|nr:NAD-dependent epimerase/dehydratase family protein [Alphaproteobacteria bacterium]
MLLHGRETPTDPARVVVIGASGFVGGAIARRLAKGGVSVRALGRGELDLLAPDAVSRLMAELRPEDSVVMVAARTPARTVPLFFENLRLVEPLAAALAKRPIAHLLYISSDAIYADAANPVTEASPAAPSTLHGMMHAARELVLKSATAAPIAFLRPTLIYGAADPHSGYGPNRFRREAEAGGPIRIFGEGEERRDHVCVEDVAELAWLILRHRSSGALNAATGVSTAFCDIARIMSGRCSVAVLSQPRPGARPHLLHRHFDIAECYKAFPRFRYTPLAKGLAALCEGGPLR